MSHTAVSRLLEFRSLLSLCDERFERLARLAERGETISRDELEQLRSDSPDGDRLYALATLVFNGDVITLLDEAPLRLGAATTLPHFVHQASITFDTPLWWKAYLGFALHAHHDPSETGTHE